MEPVRIGIQEIYDLLKLLDSRLDAYMRAQEPQIATLLLRIANLEEEMKERSSRNWLLYTTAITAIVALLAAFVAPLVSR